MIINLTVETLKLYSFQAEAHHIHMYIVHSGSSYNVEK